MPPVENVEAEDKDSGTSSKPVIGIIYPPPEVRNIVDKTASFVARNGPEFETRIRQNELNNPKFNFLNPNDPYHAYYQHKVKEFKEGKATEPKAPSSTPMLSGLGLAVQKPEPVKIVEPVVPKEPPPEFEFIADAPSISAFDLDVVKLTAQFVARNGRPFLTNLMSREQRNYQFDFLRPQHCLFNYFTKLVEQYTKVLIPPKDMLPKLRKEADNPAAILEQVTYRVEWVKYQERQKKKEEEAIEKERVAYAQIDWHDFVVVETVDFQQNEQGNLPPPTTPDEVGARLLAQERFQNDDDAVEMEVESDEDEDEDESDEESGRKPPKPSDDNQVRDMEEGSSSEDEEGMARPPAPPTKAPAPPPPPPQEKPQPPPLPPAPDQVIIRKDYNPKNPKPAEPAPPSDKFLISPITGEKIPVDKVQEHMRIGLLDPKWIEQRDRAIAEKRDQEEVYAAGSAIDTNLKLLAERRSDIFGVGAEEAQIGKKIGEEEKKTKEKVTWDGHTASMEKVTQKARENISIEEQIAVIHKVKGLVQDEEKEKIGPAMPRRQYGQPQPPQPPLPPSMPKPPAPPPPSSARPPQPPVSQPPRGASSMLAPPPQPPMQPPRQPPMMVLPPRPPMQPPVGMRPVGMAVPPPMPPGMSMGFMGTPHRMGQPPPPPQPPQPMKMPHRGPTGDEPANKKAKTEDDLIPEDHFLRMNKGPVTFIVQVPKDPSKSEWKLNGQNLPFTLPLTDAVSVIKAKIHEALGMPAGKQKLQFDGLFIKDSNTLAFYNFSKDARVSLQVKERGGRKK